MKFSWAAEGVGWGARAPDVPGLGGVTRRKLHTDMGLGAAQRGHMKDEKQKMEFLFQEHLWTCVLCEPEQLVRTHGPHPAGEPDSEPAPRSFWKTQPVGQALAETPKPASRPGFFLCSFLV